MTNPGQPTARLPLLNKLLFASDHIGLQAISYFRQQWALFFLAPPALEGVARVPDVSVLGFEIDARVLAGFLIFSGRFIDAFTDPLIGWWSDRTRSRWGRRIPFILFSTPFYALFGALIWFLPDDGSSWWNVLYFVLMLELFFTAATMSSGALEALVPELTRDRQRPDAGGEPHLPVRRRRRRPGISYGRVHQGRFWLSGRRNAFRGGRAGVPLPFAVGGVATRPAGHHAGTSPLLARNARHPAQFPVRRFPATYVMFTTGAGVLQGWIPFFAVGVLLQERDGAASSWLSTSVIGGVVLFGIFIWLLFSAGRVSKRRIYGICLVASGLLLPWLGLVGLVLPGHLVLQGLISVFIAGMPMAAVFLLPKGLIADIADYDALLRNERREAMFYSTQNFFEKLTYALPPLLLSLILLLGDSPDNPLGIRLAPLLAGALVLTGITLWPRYRLPDTVDRQTVTAAGLLAGASLMVRVKRPAARPARRRQSPEVGRRNARRRRRWAARPAFPVVPTGGSLAAAGSPGRSFHNYAVGQIARADFSQQRAGSRVLGRPHDDDFFGQRYVEIQRAQPVARGRRRPSQQLLQGAQGRRSFGRVVVVAGYDRQSQQRVGGHGAAAGLGVVKHVARRITSVSWSLPVS